MDVRTLISELDQFEGMLEECEGRVKFAALNAIDHLRKAELLMDADPQMSAFRAFCAEEEAATALVACLQRHGYPESDRINLRAHDNKCAVMPFVRAVVGWLKPRMFEHNDVFDLPRLRFTSEPGRRALELVLPLKGMGKAVHPRPPLGVVTQGESTAQEMIGKKLKAELRRFLDGEVRGMMRQAANERNKLLYASEEKMSINVGNISSVLATKANNVGVLLIAIGLIDPWVPPTYPLSSLVSDAVREFVRVMSKR
jgi:hypothetical protein